MQTHEPDQQSYFYVVWPEERGQTNSSVVAETSIRNSERSPMINLCIEEGERTTDTEEEDTSNCDQSNLGRLKKCKLVLLIIAIMMVNCCCLYVVVVVVIIFIHNVQDQWQSKPLYSCRRFWKPLIKINPKDVQLDRNLQR